MCASSSLCLRASDRPSSLASASLSCRDWASRSSCCLCRSSSLESCSHWTSICRQANIHQAFQEATSHIVTRKHILGQILNAWLTLALYRFASSAISTACLTWRQADHSLCCASCWLARAARRATSNSSRSLKEWQTKKCRINIKH